MNDDIADDDADSQRLPRMPDISGVEVPRGNTRLTDSFFELVGKDWVPRIIDDPTFPVLVLTALWGISCSGRSAAA
jgi:hypothetical protein